jgi:hypothetical protein
MAPPWSMRCHEHVMPDRIILLLLATALSILVVYIWRLCWFDRHPWPGSTRKELEEQMRRNHEQLERERREHEHDVRKEHPMP